MSMNPTHYVMLAARINLKDLSPENEHKFYVAMEDYEDSEWSFIYSGTEGVYYVGRLIAESKNGMFTKPVDVDEKGHYSVDVEDFICQELKIMDYREVNVRYYVFSDIC